MQSLTPSQRALFDTFDPPRQTPFIDVGNRFIGIGSTVQPGLLGGMSWTQIAASLTHPTSAGAQAIAGEAEVLTAELCEATNGNPGSVCSAPVVTQYETALPLLTGPGGGCPPPPPPTASRAGMTRDSRLSDPVAGTARCGV